VRPFKVVEKLDLDDLARELRITCEVRSDGDVRSWNLDLARKALCELHVRLTSNDDPELDVMRAIVLRGERPAIDPMNIPDVRAFLAAGRAGQRGVGPQGWLYVYDVDHVAVAACGSSAPALDDAAIDSAPVPDGKASRRCDRGRAGYSAALPADGISRADVLGVSLRDIPAPARAEPPNIGPCPVSTGAKGRPLLEQR
jgi:hypothetical protein